MSTTTTAPKFTAERVDGQWTVIRTDDTGRQVVDTFATREQARAEARKCNERYTAQVATVAPEPQPDKVEQTTEAFRALTAEQQDEVRAEVIREDVLPTPPPARTQAAKASRVTLARVQVGDRLMTNLVTEGNGIVYAAPHRFSDGQIRTVAEVTTRKASQTEMPGTLYTLVFTDGTVSEERYGTTSHYPAEAFDVEQPAPAPTEVPKPKKAPAPKKPAAPKIATVPSRAGKLQAGDRLVIRDLGVVTVTGLSKTGDGKVEVAYDDATGNAGVREMWASTNVRLATDA